MSKPKNVQSSLKSKDEQGMIGTASEPATNRLRTAF